MTNQTNDSDSALKTPEDLRLFNLAMRFYREVEAPSGGEVGFFFGCLIARNEAALKALLGPKK